MTLRSRDVFLRYNGYAIMKTNMENTSRQGIPFPLRPLYLLDFRKFRAGSWDTFGTVDRRDIAY